jgi:hypothetical protein
MEELKERLAFTDVILKQARLEGPEERHHEHIALQFRKMLELIAFASLAANKQRYAEAHAEFASHWNAKRLLANLKAINAEFYPRPIELKKPRPEVGFGFDFVTSGFLTQDEFIELYQHTSVALHVRNPFKPELDWSFGYSIDEWINRIIMLMRLHQIKLVDSPDYWIVMLASEQNKRASLIAAVKVGDT